MNNFKPMLFTCMKNYSKEQFLKDLVSGVIVAIIALPLSIALALASGVGPNEGIYTAIVAGFLISFLGGSIVQIAGPTAAFATIVAGIVAKNGMEGLVVATADYTTAQNLLTTIGDLDSNNYTDESWDAVTAAKLALGTQLNYTVFYQPLVDKLTADLQAAYDNLEIKEVAFSPKLEGLFRTRFYEKAQLLHDIDSTDSISKEEVRWVEKECTTNLRQRKIYRAVWFLLRDLVKAHWVPRFRDGKLILTMPNLMELLSKNSDSFQASSIHSPESKAFLRSWMENSRVSRLQASSDLEATSILFSN